MKKSSSSQSRKYSLEAWRADLSWSVALLFLLSVLLVVLAVFGDQGTYQALNLKREILKSNKRIANLMRDNLELKLRIVQFHEDPFWVEKIAREELGLARPGEKIYRINRSAGAINP